MKNLALIFALAAVALPAAASATTVDISATSEGTQVASGSFSYATGTTGVLGYGDLTAFSLTVAGATYTLADVNAFTDYKQFEYNTDTNMLETNTNSCGFAGCGFVSILSAVNSSGTSGFFFNPPPGQYAEYSMGVTNEYDTLTLTAGSNSGVPEPATWAMMLLGFGMVGAGLRYRRKGTTVRFA